MTEGLDAKFLLAFYCRYDVDPQATFAASAEQLIQQQQFRNKRMFVDIFKI